MSWDSSNRRPLRRSDGLLVEEIGDEIVAYETDSREAHCLSPLAAAVFAGCDGRTDIEQLADGVASRLGEPVGVDDVRNALAQLEERGLLARPAGGMTRRGLVRKTAIATAAMTAVPMITSITPSAFAQAASPSPACPRDLCASQADGDVFCNTVGVPEEDSCECEDCSALTALGIACPTPTPCQPPFSPETNGGCTEGKNLDGLCVLVPGDT